jgi:predicted CoA-binding protein
MSASHKTLVLGASGHPWRYSYKATERLLAHGHPVVLLGAREGEVLGQPVVSGHPELEGVHTVTVYLSLAHQAEYADYLLNLKPARVIFNPGAENPALQARLQAAGVEVLEACTLVMLGGGMY